MSYKTLLTLIILSKLFPFQKVNAQSDSLPILQLYRVNISANSFSTNISTPDFTVYANDFKFGNKFTTSLLEDYTVVENFNANSKYGGFHINFVFNSNLFKDSLARVRNKLSFSFEAGTSEAKLYQIAANDTSRFAYNFKSNIFRMTFAYQYFISKKGRFRIYTGLELINEINISAAVFEIQYASDFDESTGERKLFARKGYNLYLNVPIGFDYRLFKKASIFWHTNLAIGFENLDPIRRVNFYTGSRFGFSLAIQ